MKSIIKEDEYRIINIEPPEIFFPKETIWDPMKRSKYYIVRQKELIEEKNAKRSANSIFEKYQIEVTALMLEDYLKQFPHDFESVVFGLFTRSNRTLLEELQNNLFEAAKQTSSNSGVPLLDKSLQEIVRRSRAIRDLMLGQRNVIFLKLSISPICREIVKSEFVSETLIPCIIGSLICEKKPIIKMGGGALFVQLYLLIHFVWKNNSIRTFTFNKYRIFMRIISRISYRVHKENQIEEDDIKILRRIYYGLLRIPGRYERLDEYSQAMIDEFDPLRIFCLSVIDNLISHLEKEFRGILTGRCKYCGNIFKLAETAAEKTHCKPEDGKIDCEKKEKNDLRRGKGHPMLEAKAVLLNKKPFLP